MALLPHVVQLNHSTAWRNSGASLSHPLYQLAKLAKLSYVQLRTAAAAEWQWICRYTDGRDQERLEPVSYQRSNISHRFTCSLSELRAVTLTKKRFISDTVDDKMAKLQAQKRLGVANVHF